MSDIPNVQLRVADVLKGNAFAPCGPIQARQLAIALAAAGLLADPTGSRTDTEQAVIDAAIRIRAANYYPPPNMNGAIVAELLAPLYAAVDRLTATEEAT